MPCELQFLLQAQELALDRENNANKRIWVGEKEKKSCTSHQMTHLCYVAWHQRAALSPASVKAGEEAPLAVTPISVSDNQKRTKQQSGKVTLPSCSQFYERKKHQFQTYNSSVSVLTKAQHTRLMWRTQSISEQDRLSSRTWTDA